MIHARGQVLVRAVLMKAWWALDAIAMQALAVYAWQVQGSMAMQAVAIVYSLITQGQPEHQHVEKVFI